MKTRKALGDFKGFQGKQGLKSPGKKKKGVAAAGESRQKCFVQGERFWKLRKWGWGRDDGEENPTVRAHAKKRGEFGEK